ncbi:MAG: efflux RND transporter periplasmic adaptor subunit [Gammaproteobacteria bacterium]|nr:efflux RND transporter periplasmic adaptor subunit [Gammaproteobacteria bacterium]MDH3465950.1 efflux RND transporter periplasmic adaptor subunit [Gammaproteobacteria bacterium]
MKILLPLLFIVLGLAGLMTLLSNRPDAASAVATEKVWAVAIQSVRRERLSPVVNLFGRIESPRAARLSAALASDVLEVTVAEGQYVTAGAALVRLDNIDARNRLSERKAEAADISAQIESENQRHLADQEALRYEQSLLALARKSVQRAERLASTQVGAESQVDDARRSMLQQELGVTSRRLAINDHTARLAQLNARRARARALQSQAERDVSRSQIVAPYDGRITAVHVARGDRVRIGDGLVDLYDVGRTEVRAQIPTRHLAGLRNALYESDTIHSTLKVDGRILMLRLDRLAGQVEIGSGGVDAFFHFTDQRPGLELGRTVDLRVELPAESDVFAVPLAALYGRDRIYKMDDGRLKGVAVERVGDYVDGDGNSKVLIRSGGIDDGDQVVISQLPNAVDGLRIEARAN